MLGSTGEVSWLLPGELKQPAQGGCIWFLRRLRLLTKNTGLCLPSSFSLNRAALTATSKTAKYTKSVSPASALARTGGSAKYYLIAIKVLSHSSFHPARLAPLRVAKNGFRRSVN